MVRALALLSVTLVVVTGCGGSSKNGSNSTPGPSEPGAGTVVSDAPLANLDPALSDAASWTRGMTYRSRSGIDDDNTHVTGSVFVPKGDPVRFWSDGLDIPIGGETVLFVDCEAAFYRTSVPRAVAQILTSAGVEFELMDEQWCCGGPAAEMGYLDQARRFAQHNLDNWRATGAKGARARSARLHQLHRGLPEVLRCRVRHGGRAGGGAARRADPRGPAQPERAGGARITSRDRVSSTSARASRTEPGRSCGRSRPDLPRRRPGHPVVLLLGGGGGLPVEKPGLTAAISARRLDQAATLEVDTLVSACPWSERPLSAAGDAQETSTCSTSTSCSPSRSG